jgi:hypothetical protein
MSFDSDFLGDLLVVASMPLIGLALLKEISQLGALQPLSAAQTALSSTCARMMLASREDFTLCRVACPALTQSSHSLLQGRGWSKTQPER